MTANWIKVGSKVYGNSSLTDIDMSSRVSVVKMGRFLKICFPEKVVEWSQCLESQPDTIKKKMSFEPCIEEKIKH